MVDPIAAAGQHRRMVKSRPPGSRAGKTFSLELAPELKAALQAEADRRGIAAGELVRRVLTETIPGAPGAPVAGAAAPSTPPADPRALQRLLERFEAAVGRLEALERKRSHGRL
jgi:hypothetical protein